MHYADDVVVFNGATFQAKIDTALPPDSDDWTCLARAGRDAMPLMIRGTYDPLADYAAHDVVIINGASFVARQDQPGECPGAGWQLMAEKGRAGRPGERGPPGPKGDPGPPAPPAPSIVGGTLDPKNYRLTLSMSDGSDGPSFNLTPFFEQYSRDSAHG